MEICKSNLQEAQNELTLIKTIGLNSPEMSRIKKEIRKLRTREFLAEKVEASNYQQILSKAGL